MNQHVVMLTPNNFRRWCCATMIFHAQQGGDNVCWLKSQPRNTIETSHCNHGWLRIPDISHGIPSWHRHHIALCIWKICSHLLHLNFNPYQHLWQTQPLGEWTIRWWILGVFISHQKSLPIELQELRRVAEILYGKSTRKRWEFSMAICWFSGG